MIIIEIALGIVLAVLILNFLPELIAFGGIVIIIGVALVCAVLLFYWVDSNPAAIGSVLLLALVALLYRLWEKNFAEVASVSELKELIHRRQLLGYDTSDLSVELKNAISASIKIKNNNVINTRRELGYNDSNNDAKNGLCDYITLSSRSSRFAVTKVGRIVSDGGFFLDFTRKLDVIRWFGTRNRYVGPAVGLLVPVIHEAENSGGFIIGVSVGDPYFRNIQKLWKAHYPSCPVVAPEEANGLKIIADFATQFPIDSQPPKAQ